MYFRSTKHLFILAFILTLVIVSLIACKSPIDETSSLTIPSDDTFGNTIVQQEHQIDTILLKLETEYRQMLAPIQSLKQSHPKIYWFVVSWLNPSYGTPNWHDYGKEDWQAMTKQKGIDCSGFVRVMLDEIFDKQVRGGSQGLLDHYCQPIKKSSLRMGDLIFFKAPYSKSYRIVHVGIYLQDDYFVHATSSRSAAKGLGLSINNLTEKIWQDDYASAGRVK